MAPRMILTVLAVSLTTGCAVGPSLKSWSPAQSAGGAKATIATAREKLSGEVLSIDDGSLLLLQDDGVGSLRLVRIPLVEIASVQEGESKAERWNDKQQERYRLLARYPAGVTPELERRLLAAYGFKKVEDASRWQADP